MNENTPCGCNQHPANIKHLICHCESIREVERMQEEVDRKEKWLAFEMKMLTIKHSNNPHPERTKK